MSLSFLQNFFFFKLIIQQHIEKKEEKREKKIPHVKIFKNVIIYISKTDKDISRPFCKLNWKTLFII